MKLLTYLLLAGILLFSCKKDGSGPGNQKGQRIKSINSGSEIQIFEYDGQGRITRLYYNASNSLKLTYSPIGINIQRLGSGDVPDPDRKQDLTIVNNRVTTGTEYLPNKVTRKFNYAYDDQGKLNEVFVMVQYDGVTSETHHYRLSYNTQNNLEQINFVRKDNAGNDKSDSVFIRKTYYDKKFITWGNMGLDYFGIASPGQRHLGYGITVPFFLASLIFPSNNAVKSETTDEYHWNPVTQKWVFDRTSGFTINELDYKHDASGRLIGYYGSVIEWQ